MKRIIISEEAKADIRAIPQHIVADYRVRFTEESPDTLRIHTVKNRKDSYR